ncbi:MAG: sulfide/dihydroorotate dehydrogenase-like FAD/NAD-binding protein [Clostridiales bacterium]|nr:sulfide/dihydroorotate dehydrogenase-like FAD/NAD-binding protein [Clostridiales bacterium]
MYKILNAKRLNENIFLLEVEAKWVAKKCLAGQFVIVRCGEDGERIPLTIADYDREKGSVTVVVQEVGASTKKMGALLTGDYLTDFVGPLGNPSEIIKDFDNYKGKEILFVAGGLGTAPVYPQVKDLSLKGKKCDVIIGSRNKDLLILNEEMKAVAKDVYVCTDDGSFGFNGRVTDLLENLVKSGKKYDLCVAIGPVIMMKFVCMLTKKLEIPTIVSMNPIMVDGTGMCGACRVTVGGEVKFACVDGPEFDGHKVDFDEAMKRQSLYKTQEGRMYLKEKEGSTHHGGCGFCGGENE